MGPPQVSFHVAELCLPPMFYVCVCHSVCFLILGSDVVAGYPSGGLTVWVGTTANIRDSVPLIEVCLIFASFGVSHRLARPFSGLS